MSKKDVIEPRDIEDIIERFYEAVLDDSIIGFIFTDVAQIDLAHHLPIIVSFWADSLFKKRGSAADKQRYKGNPLKAHVDLHEKFALRPGHFTRWLFLFNKAVDERYEGVNADAMKSKAEQVAKSISAALVKSRRGEMDLVLKSSE